MSTWTESVPMVTAVVHSFQHQAFIESTVRGVLWQRTTFPFKLLIHDDASTDGTQAILRRLAESYPQIIRLVLQEENQYSQGYDPFGTTFPLIDTEFVALCEGDDFWINTDKLQLQVDHLRAHPETVVVGHNSCIVRDNVVTATKRHEPWHHIPAESLMRCQGGMLSMLTLCFRFAFLPPPEFRHVVSGDRFLLCLLAEHGDADFLPQLRSAYRQHDGGVWTSKNRIERAKIQFQTHMWMGRYFARVGRTQVADFLFWLGVRKALMRAPTPRLLRMVLVRVPDPQGQILGRLGRRAFDRMMATEL